MEEVGAIVFDLLETTPVDLRLTGTLDLAVLLVEDEAETAEPEAEEEEPEEEESRSLMLS